ncbi:MAG: ABC-type transport system involved in cytochrome c biosis, permease component [Actinomycetia bacterium]|nr:ABC-type transport system involved in cytochrome c biosis, permease component [Actinomycetes bacterium]
MKRGTGSALTMSLGAAALVSLVATYAYGLSLPETVEQGHYSKLIAIHPGVAWASYVAFGVMAGASVLWLWSRTRSRTWDLLAGASAEVGVLFTTLTLITGSIWGRPTWGVWWVWDARLTLSALMLTLLLGYLAMRRVPSEAEVRARRSAVAALLAVVVVPVNHFAVEWWRTLHQGRSLSQVTPGNDLDGQFIFAMVLGFLAMTLVYAWLTVHRLRVARLEEDVVGDDLDAALEARRREAVTA